MPKSEVNIVLHRSPTSVAGFPMRGRGNALAGGRCLGACEKPADRQQCSQIQMGSRLLCPFLAIRGRERAVTLRSGQCIHLPGGLNCRPMAALPSGRTCAIETAAENSTSENQEPGRRLDQGFRRRWLRRDADPAARTPASRMRKGRSSQRRNATPSRMPRRGGATLGRPARDRMAMRPRST
jgi:hypothetical protein